MKEILIYIGHHIEIGTILSVLVSIYLYSENRRLKRYDAEKEYQIWNSELERIEKEYQRNKSAMEKEIDAKFEQRGFILSDRRTPTERDADFQESLALEENFWAELTKVSAKTKFYKRMKDHSTLWFLKKEEDLVPLFLKKPSKLRILVNKILMRD